MPSTSDIRPTRLEYIRTKRRILIARKGLKLLKLKRQALILEFFNTSKTAAALRESSLIRVSMKIDLLNKPFLSVGNFCRNFQNQK